MARPAKFTDRSGQRIKPARVGVILRPSLAVRIKSHCARIGVTVSDWLSDLAVEALKKEN